MGSAARRRPVVSLKNVAEPQKHRTFLHGRVWRGKSVQVLVFSHDSQWYLQDDAILHGTHWKAECCYGFEDSGGQYIARAVTGARLAQATYASLDDLPAGTVLSNAITIERAPLDSCEGKG